MSLGKETIQLLKIKTKNTRAQHIQGGGSQIRGKTPGALNADTMGGHIERPSVQAQQHQTRHAARPAMQTTRAPVHTCIHSHTRAYISTHRGAGGGRVPAREAVREALHRSQPRLQRDVVQRKRLLQTITATQKDTMLSHTHTHMENHWRTHWITDTQTGISRRTTANTNRQARYAEHWHHNLRKQQTNKPYESKTEQH